MNFLHRFSKNPQISNLIKFILWEPSGSMRRGGQTDMKKLIILFAVKRTSQKKATLPYTTLTDGFLLPKSRVFTPHYKQIFKQNRLSIVLKKLGLSILKSTSNISSQNKTTLRQTYIENVRVNKSSYLVDNTKAA